jgi:hypothetical protein
MLPWAFGESGMRKVVSAFITSTVSACVLYAAGLSPAFAAESVPNFSPNSDTGWIPARPAGDDFISPDNGPGPVTSEKAHPYIPNGQGQPTYRIADLSNPILKPWAIEQMRRANDEVRAGKVPFTADSRCWPAGVPGFDVYAHVRPIYFLQTSKEVTIINESDMQVRHIYLNVPHSAHRSPSWYGDSVGHYEGDELVVDTVGMNDKTFVDNYRTPHTAALHVVERFRLVDRGNILQATIKVEDPGAFNMPWSAVQRWRRRGEAPIIELSCAENLTDYFGNQAAPAPQADKPDF